MSNVSSEIWIVSCFESSPNLQTRSNSARNENLSASRSTEHRNSRFHHPGIAQLTQMALPGELMNMTLTCRSVVQPHWTTMCVSDSEA